MRFSTFQLLFCIPKAIFSPPHDQAFSHTSYSNIHTKKSSVRMRTVCMLALLVVGTSFVPTAEGQRRGGRGGGRGEGRGRGRTPTPPAPVPVPPAPVPVPPGGGVSVPPVSVPPVSVPPPVPVPSTPPAPTGGGFGNARTTPGQGIEAGVRAQYLPVVSTIVGVIESQAPSFRPLLVRLAWHSLAHFDSTDRPIGGGNGGCLRTDPELGLEENIGLDVATRALEAVKSAHPFVSYADLYSLAGNTALEYMGSPTLFFRAGRTDFGNPAAQCVNDNDRMPTKHFNNDNFPHLDTLDYFFDKFGELGISLDSDANALEKMVSLMGGHNMGAMHLAVSGNEGQWTTNNLVFGTEYFANLDQGAWGRNTAEEGRTDLQYRGGPGRRSVMLPIDMVMRADDRLRSIVRAFSHDRALFETHFVAAWRQLQENGW